MCHSSKCELLRLKLKLASQLSSLERFFLTRFSPVPVSGSAGAPRYSASSYGQMVRPPVFTPRLPMGPLPVPMLARPPGTGIRPMPPVLKPPPGMLLNDLAVKGLAQVAAPPEKPHTTVYVGKISSTVEDEFLRAILQVVAFSTPLLTCMGFVFELEVPYLRKMRR